MCADLEAMMAVLGEEGVRESRVNRNEGMRGWNQEIRGRGRVGTGREDRVRRCFGCGQPGHFKKDCLSLRREVQVYNMMA